MARPETLVVGNCYYLFGFHDENLLFRCIQTLVHVGVEDDLEGGRYWLFRKVSEQTSEASEQQRIGIEYDNSDEDRELPDLQQRLTEIAPDHPIRRPLEPDPTEMGPCDEFGEMTQRVLFSEQASLV
jgi:hypothetical protein